MSVPTVAPSITVPLSLVIPTRRPRLLRDHLMRSVSGASPRPAQVIVVDDHASPPVEQYLEDFPDVRLLRLPEQGGPARARNAGAALAIHDVIVFLDDDVVVSPDLFARLTAHFRDRTNSAVTGLFSRQSFYGNFCSRYKNDYMHYICRRAGSRTATLLTAICAVRRDAFRETGGFDEAIRAATVEDIDLGRRLSCTAPGVCFDPQLQVIHLKRYGPLTLLNSHFQRSRDMARYLLRRGAVGLWSQVAGSQERLSLPWHFAAGVMLTATAMAATVAAMWWPGGGLSVAAAALILALAANLPFLRFVAGQQGMLFALVAAPVLVMEFAVSVVAALWAVLTQPFWVRRY